jgi:biotin carboxylase
MKRVLLLAATTGYQTQVFAEAAHNMGLEVVMATDRCHVLPDPWGDQAIPIRFEDPEGAAATLAATQPRPDAIVAVGDRPVYLAALAARELNLAYNSPESVAACKNKFAAREKFRANGMLVPAYLRLPVSTNPHNAATNIKYPCVLKPLGLSASRGVIRANNPTEFAAAFERIHAILEAPEIRRLQEEHDQFIQVENYIDGREYALEGIVTEGRLKVLAIFDKPDPLEGPFFEETIYVTPSREPQQVQHALIETAQQAVTALGLTTGPLHAELRHNLQGVWILEVAARPIGGLCAKALRFRNSAGLEELILRHALGENVSRWEREAPASGVMMIPIPKNGVYQRASGAQQAAHTPNITEVVITAKEGQKLEMLPEGASYLGFIFAHADRPDQVENALRAAHAKLSFEIATGLAVV